MLSKVSFGSAVSSRISEIQLNFNRDPVKLANRIEPGDIVKKADCTNGQFFLTLKKEDRDVVLLPLKASEPVIVPIAGVKTLQSNGETIMADYSVLGSLNVIV